MPSYMIRHLPPGLISRAKERARAENTALDTVLIACLTAYAEKGPQGRAGGQARAASLSPERRSEIAKAGGQARWKDHQG